MVLGAGGQLGKAVREKLSSAQWKVVAFSHSELDITRGTDVFLALQDHRPDVVINCAAITDVDFCEEHPEIAENVHIHASEILSRASRIFYFLNVYISTDYVFDGESEQAYAEEAPANPVNHYGRTKWLGEIVTRESEQFLIIRTSAVFGKGEKNFVTNFLRRAQEGKSLRAVGDRRFSPTYTVDLAEAIYQLIDHRHTGIFHITNSEFCSPYQWALEICKIKKWEQPVEEIRQADLHQKARRPRSTILSNTRWLQLGFPPLPSWKDALTRFLV